MTSEGVTPEVVVLALGVPVGIAATGDVAARLRHQWSRSLTEQAPATVVDLDHLPDDDAVGQDYALSSRVTIAALDATAGRRLNLHAGAVADDAGRVLTVIGASGAGKTTAVRRLAERLGYVSDETTSVDDDLIVVGHPKPLSVITDPSRPLAKRSLSPDELGLRRPPSHTVLHRMVLLSRGSDAAGLVPVAPAHAIGEIVAQTSSLTMLDHPLLRLAETIDACGGAWQLHYTEVEDWVDELVGLLDADARPAPERRHHPGGVELAEPGADHWSRVPWLDAVEYVDELALMIGDRVHVLAGLGIVLWLGLASPRTLDDLVADVRGQWGDHPDAPALVSEALHLLAQEGMVRPPP